MIFLVFFDQILLFKRLLHTQKHITAKARRKSYFDYCAAGAINLKAFVSPHLCAKNNK